MHTHTFCKQFTHFSQTTKLTTHFLQNLYEMTVLLDCYINTYIDLYSTDKPAMATATMP